MVQGLEWTAVADAALGVALLVAVAFLGARLAAPGAGQEARWRPWALLAGGALLLLFRVTVGLGAGRLAPETLRTLEALERDRRPLDAVCAPPPLIDWVPALAGRPPGESASGAPGPWIPPALRDEWIRRRPQACSKILD